MKKYSRILIIANLLLLLAYFNWSVYQKEQILKDGQLILLQLAPVDPRSLMQGDYMRLNYKEATSALLDDKTEIRGYAILSVDTNHVAHIVRLQTSLNPKGDDESAIQYKLVGNRLLLGAESFFFEEGQDALYQRAVYGGLKVDNQGQSLLIGLYDEDFCQLKSEDNRKVDGRFK